MSQTCLTGCHKQGSYMVINQTHYNADWLQSFSLNLPCLSENNNDNGQCST